MPEIALERNDGKISAMIDIYARFPCRAGEADESLYHKGHEGCTKSPKAGQFDTQSQWPS
jgi:hypothetical protein